jgi:hypothetical protein
MTLLSRILGKQKTLLMRSSMNSGYRVSLNSWNSPILFPIGKKKLSTPSLLSETEGFPMAL